MFCFPGGGDGRRGEQRENKKRTLKKRHKNKTLKFIFCPLGDDFLSKQVESKCSFSMKTSGISDK